MVGQQVSLPLRYAAAVLGWEPSRTKAIFDGWWHARWHGRCVRVSGKNLVSYRELLMCRTWSRVPRHLWLDIRGRGPNRLTTLSRRRGNDVAVIHLVLGCFAGVWVVDEFPWEWCASSQIYVDNARPSRDLLLPLPIEFDA